MSVELRSCRDSLAGNGGHQHGQNTDVNESEGCVIVLRSRRMAGLLTVVLFIMSLVPCFADDVLLDLANPTAGSTKAALAPGTVSFIAINPLVFPQWTVTVDNVIKAGPNPPLFTDGSTQIAAIDDGLKGSPSAIKDDLDGTTLPLFTPIKPFKAAGQSCAFDAGLSDEALKDRVDSCYHDVDTRYHDVLAKLNTIQDDLRTSNSQFTAAQRLTGSVLASAANRGTDANASLSVDTQIANLDAAVQTQLLGDGGVYSAQIDRVSKLEDWPSAELASVQSDLVSLKTVLALQKPPDKGETSATKQDLIKRAKALLPNLELESTTVSTAVAGTDAEKNYTAGLRAVRSFTNRMRGITPSRFRFRDREGCAGLNSSRREVTYALSLARDTVHTVKLVCQNRLFLSQGIMFSTLPQRQFVGAPLNPIGDVPPGGAIPSPLPSPRNVVSAVSNTDARPVAMVLVNYGLFSDPNNKWAISFGAGLASGTEKTFIDYVGGITYAVSRTILFTLGEHLGQETVLAPGFREGQLVDGDPKTTTRYRLSPFIGISFGKQ